MLESINRRRNVRRNIMKYLYFIIALLIISLVATTCTSPTTEEPIEVTLMLDWVPNTNHTTLRGLGEARCIAERYSS